MPPEPSQPATRRSCIIPGAAIALALLLLIAIGLGWVGPVDRGKISDLPVLAGNQS